MNTTRLEVISAVVGVVTATPMQAQEMSRAENILLGTAAAIIASAVVALAGVVLRFVIRPLYRRFTYGGIDLAGQWASVATAHGADYSYTITLRQVGHDLKGTASIKKAIGGVTEYNDTFGIKGVTWEGFVSLTLKSLDAKRLSFATALFMIEDRGGKLAGHWAYRSGRTNQVEAEPITLVRER